ncbi:CsbD family protein [Micromonospora sp. AMSO12t]|uniref:CsbD family protein n=1 Tax=unclassified Micromonospora TaxID=2617518 RepID=UPI00124BC51F|nr:CsbD family protein [Micromonospora sp. AMSO12t]KAB1137406.1 CsbD family protein [Micromonospora sp. AMSO12t]
MGFTGKAKNKVQQVAGAARKRLGGATHSERMRDEGATQQSDARARQAGEHLTDAGRDVKDAFTR